MKLGIIIPTYNRAHLLGNALQSLLEAKIPAGFKISVLLVDNNSTDKTKEVFDDYQAKFSGSEIELGYEFEEQQGKSFAVNRGILASDVDLISILDDDMQIASDWFEVIEKVFGDRWEEVDFIAGKVLPIWETAPPEKILSAIKSVIAIGDHGDQEWQFGEDTPILSGGHAVIKREVFEEVGFYPVELGPSGKSLIGCEDDIFYDKILKANKKGIYCPSLTFYHFVPQYRLTKSYYQEWYFGAGMSWSLMDVHYQFFKETKILSVPRYMYRELIMSVFEKIKAVLSHNEEKSLEAEKTILIFSGLFYAKNIKDSKLDKSLRKFFQFNSSKISR